MHLQHYTVQFNDQIFVLLNFFHIFNLGLVIGTSTSDRRAFLFDDTQNSSYVDLRMTPVALPKISPEPIPLTGKHACIGKQTGLYVLRSNVKAEIIEHGFAVRFVELSAFISCLLTNPYARISVVFRVRFRRKRENN